MAKTDKCDIYQESATVEKAAHAEPVRNGNPLGIPGKEEEHCWVWAGGQLGSQNKQVVREVECGDRKHWFTICLVGSVREHFPKL